MASFMRAMRWWLPVVLFVCVPLSAVWAAGTPAGTVINNFATMQYKDASGASLPQITSNTVTTVVSQVAGVDLSPATSSKTVVAGTSVVYSIEVTNMGNGSDTFSLTYTAPAAGWTNTLYADTNSNGVLDAGEDVPGNVISSTTLAADASKLVLLVVTAPAAAGVDASEAVTVTATSAFNAGVADSGAFTASVQTAVLSIVKVASPKNPKPGDVVTYALNGSNTGTSTAFDVNISDALPAGVTYVPGSIRIAAVAGSTYDTAIPQTDANDVDKANFGVTAANTVTFIWGDSPKDQRGALYFQVKVNDGVSAGTEINNVASILYSTTSGGAKLPALNSTTETITVAIKAILTLSNTSLSGSGDSGENVKYSYTVTNGGNASDIFNFTSSSTQGFSSVIWLDANSDGIAGNDGDHMLADTNGDGKVDTGSITPGTVFHIIEFVTVTSGTIDGTIDVNTTTISSVNNPAVTGTVTLTTTANTPVMAMNKTVAPVGNQPPGTVLTYTLTITNTGHGTAKSLLIADIVPTHTTYQAETITFNSVTRTDAADGDNASLQSGSIVVDIPNMGPGGTAIITFKVKID